MVRIHVGLPLNLRSFGAGKNNFNQHSQSAAEKFAEWWFVVNGVELRHCQTMTPLQRLWLALADFVLIVHAAFCAFVVVGLVLVWIGWFRKWGFIRNFWFRALHFTCISVVVAESVFGIVCPLTALENHLRLLAGDHVRYAGSFVQEWLQRLIFFDLDERVFTMIYSGFFLAVALSYWVVPPRWPGKTSRTENFKQTPGQK